MSGVRLKRCFAPEQSEDGVFHARPHKRTPPEGSKQMKIRIGSKDFTAILVGNAAAAASKALLPMVIEMTELNGNEKYASLSGNVATRAANPGTIQTGNLMMSLR